MYAGIIVDHTGAMVEVLPNLIAMTVWIQSHRNCLDLAVLIHAVNNMTYVVVTEMLRFIVTVKLLHVFGNVIL